MTGQGGLRKTELNSYFDWKQLPKEPAAPPPPGPTTPTRGQQNCLSQRTVPFQEEMRGSLGPGLLWLGVSPLGFWKVEIYLVAVRISNGEI